MAVLIENNANASAFAEKVFKSRDSENLLSISMYSGMGLGIIMEGELLKGYNGFAGEMGHMIVVPDGKLCTCGNKGCWEMYASEARFLQGLATLKNKSNLSYEDVESWLAAKDPVIIRKIDEFFEFLAIGLNNIINLYNPETIVLNSQVLKMYPGAIDRINNLLKSSVSQYRELKLSDLGKDACAMGACALAIKSFLKVPELRLDLSKNHLPADDYAGTII